MMHEPLSVPFTTSPSGYALVLHMEEQGSEYLDMVRRYAAEKRYERVRVTFKRFLGGRMLSMGGEAGNGIGVVKDSAWLDEMNRLQKKHYPSCPDNFANVKHYCFTSHDVNVEVLAEEIHWETIQQLRDW